MDSNCDDNIKFVCDLAGNNTSTVMDTPPKRLQWNVVKETKANALYYVWLFLCLFYCKHLPKRRRPSDPQLVVARRLFLSPFHLLSPTDW